MPSLHTYTGDPAGRSSFYCRTVIHYALVLEYCTYNLYHRSCLEYKYSITCTTGTLETQGQQTVSVDRQPLQCTRTVCSSCYSRIKRKLESYHG
jgi:hypothetical protein